MILIACADDRMGISFNGRRQSSDRLLSARLLSHYGKALRIHPDSASLFAAPLPAGVVCAGDFLSAAGENDCCFWEGKPASLSGLSIIRIVLYRWNRRYPSDLIFPIDLAKGWRLSGSCDFPGYSHDTLTEEIYVKC